MRWPRPRVRTLLIGVALIALGIGGWLEYRRLKRLSDQYAYGAWIFESNVRGGVATLADIEADLARLKSSPKADPAKEQLLGALAREQRARIAAAAIGVQVFEHAASHPWEGVPKVPGPLAGPEASITQEILARPPRQLSDPDGG